MSDGSELKGTLCPEMLARPPLLGKTLAASRHHAVLGFPTTNHDWHLYTALSLPFGASASVFSFNKIALALLHIMIHKFLAIGIDFYDDFTLFEFQPAASLLDKVLMRLLSILGWLFATEGKKFVPFSPSVISLGVSLGLKDIWTRVVAVGNKPGRLEKIAEMLKAVIASDHASKSQLASLHGLVNFAGGYTLGYQLKPTARMLALALSRASPGTTADLRSSCEVALTSIALVEAYAVAIMLFALRGMLTGRSILAFIDNAANETAIWYERVASSANPSDLPSRDAVAEACRRFGCEDKGDVAITAEMQRFLTSRLYVPELGAAIAEAVRAEADLWKDLTPA
ncbi:Xab2 [Symbiodinium pilosum]|uniref:Xab2 protein n=1 Tax=Symbiodinium pilosum TaxID=2952 RepID=A0A812RB57_SYMPI|nr:Xab2 [Symbiodinium pilosum]